jgi:hypothetical protein
MFYDLINYGAPTFIIRYPELIASPVEHVIKMSEFSGLKVDPAAVLAASNFITVHSSTYRHGARPSEVA